MTKDILSKDDQENENIRRSVRNIWNKFQHQNNMFSVHVIMRNYVGVCTSKYL